jgi:selenocysteine-specific elongation factor
VSPADVAQLARELKMGRETLTQVLRVLERQGAVVRVAADMYFLSSSIQEITRIVRDELSSRDEISPAMFRDRLGITRKHAIPLLEYLDRNGVTVRVGAARRVTSSRSSVS